MDQLGRALNNVSEYEKSKREDAQRAEDAHKELISQLRSAAIENGNLAIKYLFAVNGGAAVAVLGFVGGLASQGKISQASIVRLTQPLRVFAVGVAVSVGVMLVAYIANSSFAESAAVRIKPFWYERRVLTPKFWSYIGVGAIVVAYLLAFGSLVLFLKGLLDAVDAMRTIEFNTMIHLVPKT